MKGEGERGGGVSGTKVVYDIEGYEDMGMRLRMYNHNAAINVHLKHYFGICYQT